MSVLYTVLAVLAFFVLTAGTAVFVAAEFSLTALERSTVDANARTGGRRDKLVQRAHRTLVVPALGRPSGHLDHHADHRLPRRAAGGASARAGVRGDVAARMTSPSGLALALALLIATSVSMVFGELVAQYLAVAKPLPGRACGRRSAGAVLDARSPR